jgi:U3 small nucleolar RNA-associated protein 15
MLTAGGTSLKLWDIVGGGRLLDTISAHQKLITAVTLDGTGSRLLSAGLDGLVKVRMRNTRIFARRFSLD